MDEIKWFMCQIHGHDWRANGPMYSDGWESKCARCGKVKQVDR